MSGTRGDSKKSKEQIYKERYKERWGEKEKDFGSMTEEEKVERHKDLRKWLDEVEKPKKDAPTMSPEEEARALEFKLDDAKANLTNIIAKYESQYAKKGKERGGETKFKEGSDRGKKWLEIQKLSKLTKEIKEYGDVVKIGHLISELKDDYLFKLKWGTIQGNVFSAVNLKGKNLAIREKKIAELDNKVQKLFTKNVEDKREDQHVYAKMLSALATQLWRLDPDNFKYDKMFPELKGSEPERPGHGERRPS